MNALKHTFATVGRVFGLVFGSNFRQPVDEAMENYSHLHWYV